MCRIAGILNTTYTTKALEEMVAQMCMLQKHGGPDDGGTFSVTENNLVLGNRRLSLLDLSIAGHQPMHYESNRYTITYNGELYNFKALKVELQSLGFNFSTSTDTEVILAAFAKWNVHSFSKLNGMFAFALWDNTIKKLYLVRDAAGIKPLYYASNSSGIAFASEIRAFAPVPYLQEKNNDAAVYQLAYGFIPEPATTLKHVKPVPKGCYVTFNANEGSTNLQTFNFFDFSDTIKEEHLAKEKIAESIDDAVHRQMIADANIGMFLSGGIDSSIIAMLANKKKQKELHTLSIHFDEGAYSEKAYQDLVANKVGSNHHSILLTEQNFHHYFPEVLNAMDMPSCDGVNTWFISKFAHEKGLKAVLSGLGADELFGGYPSFSRINKAIALQSIPNIALSLTSKLNNTRYNRLAYLQMEGVKGLYLFLRGHFTPIQIAEQLGAYEKDIWQILSAMPASPVFDSLPKKNIASWMEFNMYMQDQLLRDADVMSMAHGVEIRVPFLDNEVIKTAFSINDKVKYKGSFPKQLLVASFSDMLPKQIWNRPKMGFSFPFAEWLSNSVYLKELSTSSNAFTKKACKDFLDGKLHWSRIMSLIMIEHVKK
jgi:asparagine synthase (glutamine-hydrolysing)